MLIFFFFFIFCLKKKIFFVPPFSYPVFFFFFCSQIIAEEKNPIRETKLLFGDCCCRCRRSGFAENKKCLFLYSPWITVARRKIYLPVWSFLLYFTQNSLNNFRPGKQGQAIKLSFYAIGFGKLNHSFCRQLSLNRSSKQKKKWLQ